MVVHKHYDLPLLAQARVADSTAVVWFPDDARDAMSGLDWCVRCASAVANDRAVRLPGDKWTWSGSVCFGCLTAIRQYAPTTIGEWTFNLADAAIRNDSAIVITNEMARGAGRKRKFTVPAYLFEDASAVLLEVRHVDYSALATAMANARVEFDAVMADIAGIDTSVELQPVQEPIRKQAIANDLPVIAALAGAALDRVGWETFGVTRLDAETDDELRMRIEWKVGGP